MIAILKRISDRFLLKTPHHDFCEHCYAEYVRQDEAAEALELARADALADHEVMWTDGVNYFPDPYIAACGGHF